MTAPSRLLEEQVALVTGGSRGLGRAICIALAREGAKVAFNYSKSDEAAEQTVHEVRRHTDHVQSYKASVLDGEAFGAMVRDVERRWGTVDALINNAGVGQVVPLALMEEADWDHLMNTNVKGAFLCSRAALRPMVRQRRGRIVNVSSLAGVKMMQAPVHYSAAKAALRGFTEALAKEVGGFGVTVNCIAPGVLKGGVSDNLPPAKREQYLGHCALGRMGTFEEVAEVIAFMCSPRNSYMNGATIVVDGAV